jgi:hypothetical protein
VTLLQSSQDILQSPRRFCRCPMARWRVAINFYAGWTLCRLNFMSVELADGGSGALCFSHGRSAASASEANQSKTGD